MKYVDLHLHTMYSDGMDTPKQVVRTAKIKGLDMIAIADHDNLSGYYEALSEAARWGLELIPGVEISTIQHHLLGLNFDPKNEGFSRFIQYSQEIQEGVCKQRIELLRNHGVPINFGKVKDNFPCSTLGKYSILRTMMSDKACSEYIQKNHGQPTLKELFAIYLSERGIAGHVEKRRFIDWNEAIDEIHKAEGFAVFAHPTTKTDNPSDVSDLLVGVDGIEIQPRYKEKNILFRRYALEKGLFITFGSDYHGSAFDPPILSRDENKFDESLLGNIKR